MMFVLGVLVGAVSANSSLLGTAPSNFILGLAVHTLARCFFSDGLWKLLTMVPGISALYLVSSNMGCLAIGCFFAALAIVWIYGLKSD